MFVQSIQRDNGKLAFYSVGQGPVLLGLSGFACSHYNYLDLLPTLTQNFQVVLIDNRGMGQSSKTSKDYELFDVAGDAIAVMDFLGIQEFGLMGISMGGFIAQELYRICPNRIKALALLCTLSNGKDFIHPINITEEGLRQFNTFDIKIQSEFSTMSTVHPSLAKVNPIQYKKIIDLRIQHKADIEEVVRQNRAAVNFLKSTNDLSQIHCPVIAMAGREDRFVNPENLEIFAKHLKQCQTVLIDESDHFFFLEKPNEVSSHLIRFFKEVL